MAVTPWADMNATEYVDVELHIRDLTPSGTYPAVLSVPFVGTFSAPLPMPPVRDLQAAETIDPSFGELPARLYGRQLFEWVFAGPLREGFLRARQLVVDSKDARWRFRVQLGRTTEGGPDPVAALRWETLLYQKDDWWLGLETAFARSRTASELSPNLVADRPIQLFAAAAATDLCFQDDPLRELLPVLQGDLAGPVAQLIDSRVERPPLTFPQFERECADRRNHVVVLGAPIEIESGGAAVWFNTDTGPPVPVPWDLVAGAVCRPEPPALVCVLGLPVRPPGAAPPGLTPTVARLAPELHARGVRAVVEVLGPLTGGGFKTFGTAFFGRLLRSGALDEATTSGRRALHKVYPTGWEWSCPVLSLRASSDAQLFYLFPAAIEQELMLLRTRSLRK